MHKKNVTFETTPQHLTLFAPDCYDKLGTYAQMNPPLRSKEHYDRLWVAIKNYIVDVLGSDHAPHLKSNKDKEYPNTPSGMPGVQTIFPIMIDHVNNGKLTLTQLINLMCENPCRIFGIKNKGFIKEGYDADLTIVDMNKKVTIKNEMMASKCGWTPFHNYKITGFPVGTIVNGILVMTDGKILIGATVESSSYDKRASLCNTMELIQAGIRNVPNLATAPLLQTWVGLSPYAKRKPYLGPLPGYDNIVVATGHYKNGILLAPITGRLVSQLITDRPLDLDIHPFRINR